MIFNSLHFLIFFGIVVGTYYNLSERNKLIFLFLGSCYFYMAFIPAYILILFFLIGLDYILGIKIEESRGAKRKRYFLLSLVANLGTLFVFKYFNFATENLDALAKFLNWNYSLPTLRLILPIGLSFHIFQSLSYVIEVYRGKYKAERNLGIYALYVLFFPQLVAGPIERPQQLLYQFHNPHPFKEQNIVRGLELMLIGFAKKLILADNIARIVDHSYANIGAADAPLTWLTLILFTYQLYYDFSGYSDIAQGSALVLGYELMNNFERPHSSTSITEFWRKWHISLSNWLRDYLYYPLVFSSPKRTKARLYASIFITFTLIGLWHGANWTYVMLGVTHGTYLTVGGLTEKMRSRIRKVIKLSNFPKLEKSWRVFITFILVSLSWVFFRAPSMSVALTTFKNLTKLPASLNSNYLRYELFTVQSLGVTKLTLVSLGIGIVLFEIFEWYQAKQKTKYLFENYPRPVRWGWYYTLIFLILGFGYLGAPSFIYFQF